MEDGLEVEVGEFLEVVSDRRNDGEHGKAALGVLAVLVEVFLDEHLKDGVARRAEGPAIEQDLSQGQRLVGDPGIEGRQQGVPIDEVVLEGQQPEQQAPGRGRRPDRGRVLRTRDAEGGRDRGMIVGEPRAVLLGRGRLAGRDTQLTLDADQLLHERGATRARKIGQIVLDAGPVADPFPVGLEAIGHLVDPGPFTCLHRAHLSLLRRPGDG